MRESAIGVVFSSSFVKDELKVHYGNILPTELPLFNRPSFDFIYNKLSSLVEKVVVTVPDSYIPIFSDRKNIELLSVDQNLTLFEVFKLVVNISQNYSEIYIIYGDTLIENDLFKPDKETIFIAVPELHYIWGPEFEGVMVPIGLFYFKRDSYTKLIDNSTSFNSFIQKIYEDEGIDKNANVKWYDIGHFSNYFITRRNFFEARSFNRLKYTDGFLVKSSSDIFKIWSEYMWFKKLEAFIPLNIPVVKKF